jgi:cold shock CspA family protein
MVLPLPLTAFSFIIQIQTSFNTATPAVPIWQRLENTSSSANIGASVKYSNMDITTNMNADPAINTPLLGTLQWNDNAILYVANTANNSITVNEAGRHRIVVNISLNNSGTRDRMASEMRIVVHGVPTGTYSSTGFIRTSNGHQDSSLHITEVLELTAGQTIAVAIVRSANNSNNATNIVKIREVSTANIYI